MDRLRRRQIAYNETSRDHWEAFGEHRRHLTGLLAMGAAGGSCLCVLGAGNSNDLELPALLAVHREVHLVDLDAEALAMGAARQGVAGHAGLHLHGGVDVTATLGVVSGWSPTSRIGPAELEALAAWPASRVPAALPGGFDRVASTCLISQILETTAHALGRSHDQLAQVEAALRTGHIRLMARLTRPGGDAALVAEVVSSGTLPALVDLPDEKLAGVLTRLERERNHFRGVHPRQLVAALRTDAALGPLAAAVPLSPWRWRLHERTYLVAGAKFRLAPG